MRVAVIVVLGLASCNRVFDLDPTRPVASDFDFDGDGVQNADDNCPTVANLDQLDADSDDLGDACDPCVDGPESGDDVDLDGVDDACDPCTKGPQHDEDGDGVFDACDNCPAEDNPDQANADGDDLGDACDLDNTTAQRRLLFDGFADLGASWLSAFRWRATGDAVAPLPVDPTMVIDYVLWNPDVTVTGDYHVELGVVVPTAPTSTTYLGVETQSDALSPRVYCLLQYVAGWKLYNRLVTPIAVSTVAKLLLRVTTDATGIHEFCQVDGGTSLTAAGNAWVGPSAVSLFTTDPSGAVTYIDVVQE
jgi:hypothetical protein